MLHYSRLSSRLIFHVLLFLGISRNFKSEFEFNFEFSILANVMTRFDYRGQISERLCEHVTTSGQQGKMNHVWLPILPSCTTCRSGGLSQSTQNTIIIIGFRQNQRTQDSRHWVTRRSTTCHEKARTAVIDYGGSMLATKISFG